MINIIDEIVGIVFCVFDYYEDINDFIDFDCALLITR